MGSTRLVIFKMLFEEDRNMVETFEEFFKLLPSRDRLTLHTEEFYRKNYGKNSKWKEDNFKPEFYPDHGKLLERIRELLPRESVGITSKFLGRADEESINIKTLLSSGRNEICVASTVEFGSAEDTGEFHEKAYPLFENAVEAFSPLHAYVYGEYDEDRSSGHLELTSRDFEFHTDPYYFASPPFGDDTLNSTLVTDNKLTREEILEAKRLMSENELRAIIDEHCEFQLKTANGLGVWNSNPRLGIDEELTRVEKIKTLFSIIYPTLFIRRELRKRGAKLYYGAVERKVLDRLIGAFRDFMAELSLVSTETVELLDREFKLLEDKPRPRGEHISIEEWRKTALAVIPEAERHALGLDLPKPPEWMLKQRS